MDDIEKLKHLIGHWAEHNAGHADTYAEWSKKADTLKMPALTEVLEEIAEKTRRLDALFKKAESLCSGDSDK
ncbi:MAG: hypothetical protein VST72_07350 [Nitrospirota bacterium]|nr:hypothetical protein [Nitrospirota bacterium]